MYIFSVGHSQLAGHLLNHKDTQFGMQLLTTGRLPLTRILAALCPGVNRIRTDTGSKKCIWSLTQENV